MDAGLLGIDEVCSPIQMILDNEFLSALQRFVHEFQVDPDAIGLEAILSAGPGGNYLDHEHTVSYFRAEHWEPSLWSRKMLHAWLNEGGLVDVDQARQRALQVKESVAADSQMPAELEMDILHLIERAKKALVDW